MATLIGVIHLDGQQKALINSIERKLGVPEKLMLELADNWRDELAQAPHRHPDYFEHIATHFENKGTEIVAGDRYNGMIAVAPTMPEFSANLIRKYGHIDKMPLPQKALALLATLPKYAAYYATAQVNLLCQTKHYIRNASMLEIADREKPDVIILGDMHARFIAERRPNYDYIFARELSLRGKLAEIACYSSQQKKLKPKILEFKLN